MDIFHTENVYRDMKLRTGGEIYIGVVGPVRTGKSTFIKRFMNLCVLPNMEDEAEKVRTQDELPQSSGGRTITTTEPKFIPKEAPLIQISKDVAVKVKLVDCVGFMVEGASGHMEGETERMVKTPWFEKEIPFTQAAEVGTRKVITDHSTIGLVITTDGSFGELPREAYKEAEEKAIRELQKLKKPFLVLLNSAKPYGEEALRQVQQIREEYGVAAMAVNCEQMKREDVNQIMEQILYEFPVSILEFYLPKWVEMLPLTHPVKEELVERIREKASGIKVIRDVVKEPVSIEADYVKRCLTESVNMANGSVRIVMDIDDACYYAMLSEMMEEPIQGEYQLMQALQEMARMKQEYRKVLHAMEAVRMKGYGVVTPERSEIQLEKPEMIKHGSKYGVKIKAQSPSIHMIKANVVTEIAPIVGNEEQAQDLIRYLSSAEDSQEGIWDTTIFGKTVEQLIDDGISSKISMIGEESQMKLQDTMQKIVNDSNGGMVCIII